MLDVIDVTVSGAKREAEGGRTQYRKIGGDFYDDF